MTNKLVCLVTVNAVRYDAENDVDIVKAVHTEPDGRIRDLRACLPASQMNVGDILKITVEGDFSNREAAERLRTAQHQRDHFAEMLAELSESINERPWASTLIATDPRRSRADVLAQRVHAADEEIARIRDSMK